MAQIYHETISGESFSPEHMCSQEAVPCRTDTSHKKM